MKRGETLMTSDNLQTKNVNCKPDIFILAQFECFTDGLPSRKRKAIMSEVRRRLKAGVDHFDVAKLLLLGGQETEATIPEAPSVPETPAPERTRHAPRGPPDDALPDELTALTTASGEDAS
jgi:hypothetical protein